MSNWEADPALAWPYILTDEKQWTMQSHCGAETEGLCQGRPANCHCSKWKASHLEVFVYTCHPGRALCPFLCLTGGEFAPTKFPCLWKSLNLTISIHDNAGHENWSAMLRSLQWGLCQVLVLAVIWTAGARQRRWSCKMGKSKRDMHQEQYLAHSYEKT